MAGAQVDAGRRASLRRLALGAAAGGLLAGCAGPRPGGPAPVLSDPGSPLGLPPPAQATRPPRLGLALGGGAARGFAHLGVLQVLQQAGIEPQLAAGTSAGSVVAALWASGRPIDELTKLALAMDQATIADWSLPDRGLLRGEALAAWVRSHTGGRTLEQLPRPVGIVATDLGTGEAVTFRRGDVGTAVRASCSVPGVFQPVRILGRDHVDGGLAAPVPVRQAREMGADIVLAVDISTPPNPDGATDTVRLLLQTFAIMGRNLGRLQQREADLVLRPALLGIAGTDFNVRPQAIEAGRAAMQTALPDLKRLLARWRPG